MQNNTEVEKDKTESDNNKENDKLNKSVFNSGQIMLDMVLKEYEFESERNKGIQSRAGILLTFVGAVLVVFPIIINVPDLRKSYVNNAFEALPINLSIICVILSVVFLILAVIFLVRVISVNEYKRMDFSSFNKNNAKKNSDEMATALMIMYKEIVSFNHSVNSKKVNLYKKSTYMILFALITISFSILISIFV